ncbi:FecR protein [compost metagenome]
MKMTDRSSSHDALKETAVDWCIRLHDDECSDAERGEFQRWHDADPAHAAEYAKACRIWQVSTRLPPSLEVPGRPLPRRRRSGLLLARAATILLGIGACWAAGWYAGALPGNARYYLAQETRRQLVLPDASRVELNRRSTLWYLEFRNQRSVGLADGEAYFDVQRDTGRPFVIRADNATIRVTGTHFNVWSAPQRTTVTVTQGAVLTSPLPTETGADQAAELTAGMQAVFTPGKPLLIGRVDPAHAAAWRAGKLRLDDVSLRDALPLINRYLDQPLSLADEAAGELRIGGIYDTADLEQLVIALPRILPVKLLHAGDARSIASRSTGG